MDSYLLPATTYQPPSRLDRMRKLNTIIENDVKEQEEEVSEEYTRGRTLDPSGHSIDGSCSPAPSLTSSISSYYETRRQSREFDELYDVSDSEEEKEKTPLTARFRPVSSTYSDTSNRDSWMSTGSRNRYPTLVIPSPRDWPTIQKFQKHSPIPPTPPHKIPISPAVLSKLNPQAPRSSAPPSLDGSLTSEQLANSSAPPTPDLQCMPMNGEWGAVRVASEYSDFHEEHSRSAQIPAIEIQSEDDAAWEQPLPEFEETSAAGPVIARPESPVLGDEIFVDEDAGVQLPAGALDTLKHLSIDIVSEPTSAVEWSGSKEMQEVDSRFAHRAVEATPMSAISAYSFSEMSIPSPGGFFSSLAANARDTWCGIPEPQSAAPPSSTTAEHFYNAPWNTVSGKTVERIIEVDENMTDGPPTAFRRPLASPIASLESEEVQEIIKIKPAKEFDEDYEKEIWVDAATTFDRTTSWLSEQTSYMAALREANPNNKSVINAEEITRRLSVQIQEKSLESSIRKAVKFLDFEVAKQEASKPAVLSKADPIFYEAFQHASNSSSPTDSFVHRQARFDALQASRASLPKQHVDQLLGNFCTSEANRPAPQRPISMFPGKEEVLEQTEEQQVIARVKRERQALEQVTAAMWIVEAAKYLSGGRLLNSPAANVLSGSFKTDDQLRVLDLGGQPKCDWAWHCAREYPNVKTYTATSDIRARTTNVRGPSNHRLVPVEKLWQLPFPDDHFDAISARSLFTFLKNEKPLGETDDEYDMCLRECLRCLKPGGYLEFFILDAEIVHAGPRGTAASVEFGFNLKSRGYDPAPSKGWLGRVRRAGLTDIKRAWMFLPMGAVTQNQHVPPETPPPHVSMYEDNVMSLEAVHGPVGSGTDAAAISGLVGSWAWETWMLKLQMEMGRERVLEDVGAVIEEGKGTGAGWRCLSGWARKPFQAPMQGTLGRCA